MYNYLNYIRSQKLTNENFLKCLFWVGVGVFIILSCLRLFYSLGLLMDTNEHIHASYLISTGLVPYRDFFEHHHPLLWYIMLPVVTLFDRDVNIVYVARGIAVLGYLFFLLLFYKIAKRYTNNNSCGAKIAVLAFLCIPRIWYDVQTLRPDIFMYISIFAALIYFLDYLSSMKRKYLCYSYFLWFVAFLFLQKAAIAGLGFGLANLWLCFNKKIKLSDILVAAVIPVVGIICLLLTLYRADALASWWLYNFTFNTYVRAYYGSYSAGLSYLPVLSFILAMCIVRGYKATKKNITFFLIWVCLAMQLLYFAPYSQYYFLYLAFSVLLLLPYLLRFFQSCFFHFMLAAVFFICSSFALNYYSYNSNGKFFTVMQLMDYIIKHTDSDDKLQNFTHAYNLFNRDADYYWFGFNTAVIITDLHLNRGFDFNEQIRKSKPKFIPLPTIALDLIMFQHSTPMRQYNTLLLQKATKGDLGALDKMSDVNLDYWRIDVDYIKQHYKHIHTYDGTQLWERIDD